MFCWSWLAGYLQRGLGIPAAGGIRGWRHGRRGGGGGGGEREPVSMCLLCPNINLEMMLEYCPSVKHGKSVLLEWLHDFGTGTLNLLGEQRVNVLTSETIED